MVLVLNLKNVRLSAVILGLSNIVVIIIGIIIITFVYPACWNGDVLPFIVIIVVSAVRIAAMYRTANAQLDTATVIVNSHGDAAVSDALSRHERRKRYKRWLCWTRFATILTIIQLIGATHLFFNIGKHVSADRTSSTCVLGFKGKSSKWHRNILIVFMVVVCLVALLQCLSGPDVLRWRSFYSTEDNAWKAHYREVFDHGLREVLCCMGRVKYLTVLEEDEVHSVAQLLGDLVAYRASGTGHLELLAGLALLQNQRQSANTHEEFVEAPSERIEEAVFFHSFAEAAYTGLLLDFSRNPLVFACAWLYRQGILTPWTRKRRPTLEGDNWWRGHAAAFLRYVHLRPEALRRGRISQAKFEAAYFVAVLHDVKSIVIVVRGTETPEDLITDGLCRECSLTEADLNGRVHIGEKQYGHSGIVDAARELFLQIEGHPYNGSSSMGFLTSLLGGGCECEGYNVRIVGHSLGGSIAALLGLRLYGRYPNVHVFTYGPLPCVDFVTGDSCSHFVTSIVYHNEFSSRLTAASIMRLRASAVLALSEDDQTDSTTVLKFARRFFFMSDHLRCRSLEKNTQANVSNQPTSSNAHQLTNGLKEEDEGDYINSTNGFDDRSLAAANSSYYNPIPQIMDTISSSSGGNRIGLPCGSLPEMYLPGLIIHIVPQKNTFRMSFWKRLRIGEACSYKAYLANRKAFKDISVSPSMFLDHLPWRCHFAMKKVLESRSLQDRTDNSHIP